MATEKKNTPTVTKTAVKPATAAIINPFARDKNLNAGAVQIEESKAMAEVLGRMQVAKMFPRDEAAAFDKIMESCALKSLAEDAEYSYPRGGEKVSGPSIRLAEEMARLWGNIEYGLRELSQAAGFSEMEAYAWDIQTNTYSSLKFKVKHERTSRANGTVSLTDQRDIYEHTANLGARRKRACILALFPSVLKDSAVAKCRQTLIGDTSNIAERVQKMVIEFKKFSITEKQIEKRLGHPIVKMTPDEFGEMLGIHNSLRDGITKIGDWFEGADKTDTGSATGQLNAAINNQSGGEMV
jgi:hypothetical protein